MPGPLAAAGAVSEPSEYAPIGMDRAITGLWTQRSPLRDAAVPYLQAKFYSASRFDSLIDGVNREVTAKLTTARRPGSSIYNSATWSAINSFYSFKWLRSGPTNVQTENIQVIVDEAVTPNQIYDGTGPSTKTLLFTKQAGAGKARYASVGNALYFFDGIDANKYLQPLLLWKASTSFSVGNTIIDTNGNLQEVQGVTLSANIASVQVLTINGVTYVRVFLTVATPFSPGLGALPTLLFAGLTTATFLNGQNLGNITTYADNVIQVQPFTHAAYGPATDTGTVTGVTYEQASGNSGSITPTWNATVGAVTFDGALLWVNKGKPVYPLGVISPTVAPTVAPDATGALAGRNRYWQANASVADLYSVLDTAGNIQLAFGALTTGPLQPIWNTTVGGITQDGNGSWINEGAIGIWVLSTVYRSLQVILDSNGNLQCATTAGTTNTTVPTWNATYGGTTTDNSVVWTNIGPGAMLATATFGYAYAYHSLDGSVTNASPITYVPNGVLGLAGAFAIDVSGPGPGAGDPQYDQLWLYRIGQGGSLLLLLDTIPLTNGGSWTYLDTLPDSSLNAFLEAPIDDENDPPPVGAVAPTIHLGRLWVSVGATLYYSTGPDTNGGSNGYTAFNPSNNIPMPELITRTDSVMLSSGPALIVWTTTNIRLVTGTGTAASPFVPGNFMPKVGLLSYDEVDVVGSTFYLLSNSGKGVSVDPGAGYVEVGFPIGDQFNKVTTGGQNSALFSPSTGFVTWHEKSSGDTGMYYCDGQKGWFRYSPISSPESGFLWSPLALIQGGTSAVQSVETAPGVPNLLIGPSVSTGGPILFRDPTTNQDNGVPYSNSYLTMGNIELCQSGQVAEIAHIGLDSMAIGGKPTVGLLLGEIYSTPQVPFDMLEVSSADPENLPEAQTLYNDRYTALQNGVCPKCRHFQLLIQYPSQNAADELLAHTIYAAVHSERKQQ